MVCYDILVHHFLHIEEIRALQLEFLHLKERLVIVIELVNELVFDVVGLLLELLEMVCNLRNSSNYVSLSIGPNVGSITDKHGGDSAVLREGL